MRPAVNALVNALLVMDFVLLAGTSVMISQTAFSFPDIHGNLNLRQLHVTTGYWFMVLSAVHLGILFQRVVRRVGVFQKISPRI